MFTPRQARQGTALLSIIVCTAMSATAMPPPVQADSSVTGGEGDRGLAATGVEPAGGPRAPAAPPQAANAAERGVAAGRTNAERAGSEATPAEAVVRQSLNEFLIRDRSVAIQLTTATAAVAENRGRDAVAALQSVLDASADVFVWPDEGGLPVSARCRAAELFRRLPTSALEDYERHYGPDARRLLVSFQRTFDPQLLRELLRRYEFTAAGAEALRGAANSALDRGQFLEAARQYERYFAHPRAKSPVLAEDRLRAEVAAVLAAEAGIEVQLPEFDRDQEIRRGTQRRTAGVWRSELLETLRRVPRPSDAGDRNWRLALGNSQAHRQCTGSLPTLNPLWSAPHDELPRYAEVDTQTVSFESSPKGAELLASWIETRHERRLPCAGANFALVDGERVVVRDFSGVTARDLRTGTVLWQFPCAAGLSRRVADLQAAARAAATPDVPLAAAQLFNDLFAQNSVMGMLASDGCRVYCVDLSSSAVAADTGGPAANRLIALALDMEGVEAGEPVWEANGDGWCFLGPPLPVEDRLYVIAERDSLVSLLSLEARTGRCVWEQPISLVDAAIGDDPQRARQACSPTLAGGIVVCPTQLGTIVGVDAHSGALEWVYAYTETTGPSQAWRKTRAFDREYGAPEYPNLPVIVGGTVIVLAPQSVHVHGIDLQSGRQCWKKDREDAQYAATIGGDLVLLVGLRTCVARRIADGSEVWRQSVPAPAGRGLAVRDAFLLPTSDGRIVSLDLGTGRIAPDLLPRLERTRSVVLRAGDGTVVDPGAGGVEPAPVSGNLLGSGELIVACSPSGVAVYPQAGVVLDAIRDEGRTQALSASAWLERGELELRLGDGTAAEESLWKVLEGDPHPRTRAAAESRLRELLYAELAVGVDAAQRLSALDRLSVQPGERARYLARRLEHELQADDAAAALRTTDEIMDLKLGGPVAMDARGEYIVQPQRAAAAALVRHARRNPAGIQAAVSGASAHKLLPGGLIDVAESSACLETLRATRAARVEALIGVRQYQAAELLLLGEARQSDAAVRRSATERLANLWRACGLQRDAQRLLDDVREPCGNVAERETALVIVRVEIEQRVCRGDDPAAAPCAGNMLEELLSRNREYARQPPGSRVLFDRGLQGAPERFSAFSVVDVAEPRLIADLEPLQPRVWKTGDASRYDAGHFLPIAGKGDVHGVSLLEGRIVWSATPATHRTGEAPLVGPYGHEYCILQSQETVTALDPHDGRMLWRRTDVPYDAGLEKGDVNGMIADDVALAIFDADFVNYRVLDPRSGALLRAGVLEPSLEPRRRGWSFGRRLLYVTAGNEPRLKLWDPLEESAVLDMPCEGRCLVDAGLGSGLAAVLNGRRLLILDTASGETVWSTELSVADAAAARQIRGVADQDRFSIHVEQDVANSPTSQTTHDISSVPNVPLGGLLFVIDRGTRTHWSRSMPRCNLLLFPNDRLPVLVTLGRTREGQEAAFVLEVIDGSTGQTLATRSDLVRTNKLLVHSRYDAEQGLLELRGVDSQIDVRLGVGSDE